MATRTHKVTIELTAEEVEVLRRYAAENYDPAIGVTWQNVAIGWAKYALHEDIEKWKQRYKKLDESTSVGNVSNVG